MNVSVIIPTFNRRESLRRTLVGLMCQTHPEFEVVVVDDGSTDGTEELLHELKRVASFPLVPLSQANAGPARARNRGAITALGDVLIFLDDDTEPHPGCVAAHAALHAGRENLVAIGPMLPDPVRKDDEPLWIAWEHAMLRKQYDAFATREWWPPGPNHFYTGNASLRRDLFLSVGGFDATYTRQEDVELAHRLAARKRVEFTFAPEASVYHRPLRTFESWANVPVFYGRFDVERARRGDVGWDLIRHAYAGRNRLTRMLARAEWACPKLSPLLRTSLKRSADALWAKRKDRFALATLSALYNLRYLDGAREALGGAAALRHIALDSTPPPKLTLAPKSPPQEPRARRSAGGRR